MINLIFLFWEARITCTGRLLTQMQILVLLVTHHWWIGRDKMGRRVWPMFLLMNSSGNQTPDFRILHKTWHKPTTGMTVCAVCIIGSEWFDAHSWWAVVLTTNCKVFCLFERTLRVKKMLTHPKIEVTICNHQADSPLYVWPDIWSVDLQVQKSTVIHDTECPDWDQVSLNNTNTNPFKRTGHKHRQVCIVLPWHVTKRPSLWIKQLFWYTIFMRKQLCVYAVWKVYSSSPCNDLVSTYTWHSLLFLNHVPLTVESQNIVWISVTTSTWPLLTYKISLCICHSESHYPPNLRDQQLRKDGLGVCPKIRRLWVRIPPRTKQWCLRFEQR